MIDHRYNLGLWFEEISDRCSSRPAIVFDDRSYDYSSLRGMVSSLSVLLMDLGIGRGDVIAIGSDKSVYTYALMHAALRIGVTYVNIDVGSPVERNRSILRTCRASRLFYDNPDHEAYIASLSSATACASSLIDEACLSPEASEQTHASMMAVDGSAIAYIMFTSGSTGEPKGVAITHDNVISLLRWSIHRFGVSDQDVFANLSPLYFDNSVFDFYTAHFSGAAIAPIRRHQLTSPYELVEYIDGLSCTIWFSVPSLLIYLMTMKALRNGAMSSIRRFIFGGEGFPKPELRKLYDLYAPAATLTNVYGPTECSCICSSHDIDEGVFDEMAELPTLGKLNPNFDHRILGADDEDVSVGELCLIGPNVAAGYFNDAERSAQVFSRCSELGRFGKSMYRTGDLVEERDGYLYFKGRKDNQIKRMGYRIELEEIESALNRHPGVTQSVVLFDASGSGAGRLVACVATVSIDDESEILDSVRQRLPEYMLPDDIHIMSAIPKNANGKLDRAGLLLNLNEHVRQ